MNLRQAGLAWLQKNFGEVDGRTHVSKLYTDEHSWTKSYVWWFEISASALQDVGETIHLLCSSDSSQTSFNYLRIPVSFLTEHIGKLHVRPDNERLSLFISAETDNKFTELRGTSKVDFSRFLVDVG